MKLADVIKGPHAITNTDGMLIVEPLRFLPVIVGSYRERIHAKCCRCGETICDHSDRDYAGVRRRA